MMSARAPLLVCLTTMILACGPGTTPQAQQTAHVPEPADSFPMTPPDSVPHWLDTLRIGTDASVRYYPNVIVVDFHPGANAHERSAAVALVKGRVIGGFPALGSYLIAIDGDATMPALLKAIEKIRRSPAVAVAGPYVLDADD